MILDAARIVQRARPKTALSRFKIHVADKQKVSRTIIVDKNIQRQFVRFSISHYSVINHWCFFCFLFRQTIDFLKIWKHNVNNGWPTDSHSTWILISIKQTSFFKFFFFSRARKCVQTNFKFVSIPRDTVTTNFSTRSRMKILQRTDRDRREMKASRIIRTV